MEVRVVVMMFDRPMKSVMGGRSVKMRMWHVWMSDEVSRGQSF